MNGSISLVSGVLAAAPAAADATCHKINNNPAAAAIPL